MMSPSRLVAFFAAVSALLVSGVLGHLLAKDSEPLDEAVARVALVPSVIGDWHGKDEPGDEASFEMAGARSYWIRTYVNQRNKEAVLAILMCGRAGKMSVHTPEVCYGGAGYELQGQPVAFAVKTADGDSTSHLWAAQFTKKSGVTTSLRLYWGWNSRGTWEASPSPRWQFRGEPFLYKLYVARNISQQPKLAPQADPAADFLRAFVPELNRTLFTPESK